MRAYVFVALPLLLALVPWAVLMLEPRGARLRVAPFAVLGSVVSAYLAVVFLTQPVGVTRCPHALEYRTGVHDGYVWAVLYIVAVIGPAVLSVLARVHMVRRRRLPDPHRSHGVLLDSVTSNV